MEQNVSGIRPRRVYGPTGHIRAGLGLAVAAACIGAVSAVAAAMVRLSFRGLQWLLTGSSVDLPLAAAHLGVGRRVLTPVGGALLAALVMLLRRLRAHRLGREPRPYVDYIEAVRLRHGCIPLLPNCWRTLSAAFSVASGAAVGREGSMIQFAAAAASWCGRWRMLEWLTGKREAGRLSLLVACGVAGGVTTAYNAPLAGVFFAAEIVLCGLRLPELLLLAVAAGTGSLVSGAMLGSERLYPAHPALLGTGRWSLLLLPVLATVAGLLGPAYQALLHSLNGARRLPLALLWGGAFVGVLSAVDPRVWGNGDAGLSAALGRAVLPRLSIAGPALLGLLALRLSATTVCAGVGTIGGVFTPTLLAGGILGATLARFVLPEAQVLWAVVGMSCLLAAVTHAPLMATCIGGELTGDWQLALVLLPLTVLAWQVARRLSPAALYEIASENPARAAASNRSVATGTVQ